MAPTDEDGQADTSVLSGRDEDALQTPPSEGAFAVVRDLVTLTGGDVWLVSKAGPRVQKLTREWLDHWRFFAATGMRPDHVRFCKERADKAVHAQKLGLTHFIDDRIDVLHALQPHVPRLFLFGHQRPGARIPGGIQRVMDWAEVRGALGLPPASPLQDTRPIPGGAPKDPLEVALRWVPLVEGAVALYHRPRKGAVARLKDAGCTHILTLLSEQEGAREIGEAVRRSSMSWLWFPLKNGDPLSASRDAEVNALLGELRQALEGGARILVHCSAGIHRTGMIAYALLRSLGHSQGEARSDLRAMRALTAEGVKEHRLAWGERFAQSTGKSMQSTGT